MSAFGPGKPANSLDLAQIQSGRLLPRGKTVFSYRFYLDLAVAPDSTRRRAHHSKVIRGSSMLISRSKAINISQALMTIAH
jgi:hypothetical protein